MTKEEGKKKFLSALSIIASLLVYVGAVSIYLYANGWRIDPLNQQVLKTGVLTVESDPFLATLYIEGEEKGRTPKSSSLNVGSYNITVERAGYLQWKKTVEILEEKSTTVYPWLIKEERILEDISNLEGQSFLNLWSNEYKDRIFILTSLNTQEGLNTYNLWLYNINTTLWDLSSNPKVILSFNLPIDTEISFLPSPNGSYGLLRLKNIDTETSYLVDISRNLSLEETPVLETSQFSQYTVTWAKNSKYLMFESEEDLISFNTDKQTKYLLIKKTPGTTYLWSTDEQGYFYTVETAQENENEKVYAYVLTQEEMDGSNPKILVKDLFFQKNGQYLERYMEEDSVNKYSAFTNSTASTRSVGEIKEVVVNQNAQGIYIRTELASYWYNMRSKRYLLVSPYISDLVEFAPDNTKLLYKDENGYGVFTFLKEEGNPNVEIGGKEISGLNIEKVTDIRWLSNSLNLMVVEENKLYIIDKEGDNKVEILNSIENISYLGVTNSKDHLIRVSSVLDEVTNVRSINIDRVVIH